MSTVDSTETNAAGVPSLDVDLHAEDVLVDPYPAYASLREAGPVVWLETYGYYAFSR